MKKLLAIIVGALVLFGCQKLPEDRVLGVWRRDRVESRYQDGTLYPVPGAAPFSSITFKRGGIGYCDSNPMEYRISGGTLVIVGAKETSSYRIDETTSSTMLLSRDVPHTDTRNFYYLSRFE